MSAWGIYAMYYLGRVNFSIAVPALEGDAQFSAAQLGAFTAGFFWAYSLGGIPSGWVADRYGVRWIVGAGMVGSGLMNLLFISADSFGMALAAWSANGVFQSLGWAPLLGGIGRWVPEDVSDRVRAAFGSCFVAGTAITFALGAVLVDLFGIEILFTGAAMVLVPVGVIWWLAVRDVVSNEVVRSGDKEPLGPVLWLLPPSAAIGAAYVALLVWTPSYFVNVHGLTISRSGLYSAALPAIAIGATVAVGRRLRQTEGRRPALIVAILLVASSVGLGSIPLASGLAAAFVLIAVTTALVSITSSLVLGLFPSMTSPKRVAFAAGVFAFAFNMGGGAGAPVIGRLLDQGRWDQAFLLLAVIVAAGAIWTGGWYSVGRLSSPVPSPAQRLSSTSAIRNRQDDD